LRAQAEKLLGSGREDTEDGGTRRGSPGQEGSQDETSPDSGAYADVQELIHELEVHQTELELQNEELRRTQKENAKLQREFSDLYEYAPVGYLTLNRSRRIARINRTAVELLQAERNNAITAPVERYIVERERYPFQNTLARASESGEPQHTDVQLARGEGSAVWVRADVRPRYDNQGMISGWWVTLTDVTDRRKAEEQTHRANAEKGVLMRELQHRIKNDIHMIVSFLNLQAAEAQSDEALTALERARDRVDVMRRLYEHLHQQQSFTRVDVRHLVTGVIDGVREWAASDVAVEASITDIEFSNKEAIHLALIVNELVMNAIEYAFEGVAEPQIHVSLEEIESAGGEFAHVDRPTRRIRLMVQDNGRGFPPELLSGGARGFGLEIVSSLAAQHGGSMHLDNGGLARGGARGGGASENDANQEGGGAAWESGAAEVGAGSGFGDGQLGGVAAEGGGRVEVTMTVV
jgi:PAS domain S-box-containing protein